MKIGNAVVRKDGTQLRSGCESYGGGVVVSIEPFILVSDTLDMKWVTLDIDDFEIYKDIKLTDEQMIAYIERGRI